MMDKRIFNISFTGEPPPCTVPVPKWKKGRIRAMQIPVVTILLRIMFPTTLFPILLKSEIVPTELIAVTTVRKIIIPIKVLRAFINKPDTGCSTNSTAVPVKTAGNRPPASPHKTARTAAMASFVSDRTVLPVARRQISFTLFRYVHSGVIPSLESIIFVQASWESKTESS